VHGRSKKKTAINLKNFKVQDVAASRPNRNERVERLKLIKLTHGRVGLVSQLMLNDPTSYIEDIMQNIDLRGVCCPTNFVKAKLALELIDSGEAAEFLLDDGDTIKNVSRSLKAEGHKLLSLEEKDGYYVLIIEKA
jgi:tRNA 2-thiouridine synthesizing protein A